jgi:hypothetical protein
MFLKNATWQDLDGRKHRQFVVRSMGRGRGCGILDSYNNVFVLFSHGIKREEAKQVLETQTVEDVERWLGWLHEEVKPSGVHL